MDDDKAMKLCPCGYHGDRQNTCMCSPQQIQRYRSKISGPLLDRIDMHLHVAPLQFDEMSGKETGEPSSVIRQRVSAVRRIQTERFRFAPGITCNGQMQTREIEQFCNLDNVSAMLLKKGMEQLGLSGRGYHRILRIARTIADMDNSDTIQQKHVAEAIQFRRLTTIS